MTSVKRKREDDEEPSSKRRKLQPVKTIPNDYHSASSVHNYMLNDPIVDWIKFKYNSTNSTNSSSSSSTSLIERDTFFDFITEKGKIFEKSVMELLKEKASEIENPDGSPIEILTIVEDYKQIRQVHYYEKTVEAMKNQVPIIYQGVLHGNEHFKAFGSPDLLIRADIINLLVDTAHLTEDEMFQDAPKLGEDCFHYRVVDIKFLTMKLRVDTEHLCNTGRMVANKGQLIVYNTLLGYAQGFTPEQCYILGRGWKMHKQGYQTECLRCDERFGVINVNKVDAHLVTKVNEALQWRTKLSNEGNHWITNPQPSVPELYPNMCNQYVSGNINKTKTQIAKEIEDITLLWNIGVKQRALAHTHGIFKLSDPRLTTNILGLPDGTNRTMVIDRMLKFAQGKIGQNSIVIPQIIYENPYDWQKPKTVEFFIDFELLNNIFDNFDELPNRSGPKGHQSIVFMIGLGVSIRKDNKIKWEYYNFRVPELTDEHEFKIFDEMYKTIHKICEDYDQDLEDTNVYHWGYIEETVLNHINKKYEDRHDWETNFSLVNFNRFFQTEGILVKNVYSFGLKAIGKAMIEYGLIKYSGWTDSIQDGLGAMIKAFEVYENPEKNHSSTINNLIKYNEVDVRMIEKIINYLRKNHTPGIIRSVINNIINYLH